ncbi:hypothetical protein TRVA0_004S03158 [Trichomonascus vanleenenianus]|uniref:uncharacterized protein n=1 Tax=Trichomonascus vanleenenianus TaxID=2268995 RepID=UPI003ECA0D2C
MTVDSAPKFWSQPFRFIRYIGYHKPHIAVAVGLGVAAPIIAIIGTPLRQKYLYPDSEPIPTSYPIPNRPREQLTGYDD